MRNNKGVYSILNRMIGFCEDISHIMDSHNNNRDEFEESAEFQHSCGMCILQLGELSTRLPDDYKNEHTEIPWHAIKAMRNIYAHDYDGLDYDIVWNTLTRRIPELKEELKKLVSELG